ncbi:potassium-transporting ATPase subunit KdpA, partial [Salmonella enterica]|uniref:potassium-transporting ATPase subunit KdpA n=1 Tax=Salmonella enterica TaxID=28901 RepID=UPI003CF29792
YSGESQLSYLTQMLGLTVQNFLSAGVGIAVLFALIRGFTRVNKSGLGNFWRDLTGIVLYLLVPLSIVLSILLVSQGTVQNFKPYEDVALLEE